MVLFDFKSDKQFVASSDRATLQVYELTNPTANPSSIRNNHWKEVATITARDQIQSDGDEDQDDDHKASAGEEESSYDGLMFFDGHGEIEGREALTKLAQHLSRLQFRVSPQGLCFQDVTGFGEHRDFGFHYLRLNDLFNWPYHGIKTASITMWRRLVLEYTVPKRGKRPMVAGGVSKERYEELKKMIETKDEELGKLREDMEEQDWEMERLKKERGKHETELRELKKQTGKEMRQLREEMEERDLEIEKLKEESEKHEQELRDLEKKNDKELRKMSKKKDGELETLKREKDEEVEDKIDELEMLRREKDEELKKLREEVKNLKRDKKQEDGAASGVGEKGKMTVDSDEWHKLKNDETEMREQVAKKDEALRRIMNEKKDAAAEYQKLRIEKEEMMKANAAETKKLRNQLSQLPRELEQRRKQSWIQTAAETKLVSFTERTDKIISRKRPVPQDTWSLSAELTWGTGMFQYEPRRNNGSWPFSLAFGLSLVDEDPENWLPPPKIQVHNSRGSFDKDNWWFTRTTHPDGGLTMMAYYDGDFFSSILPENSYPVRLPYAWDNHNFWADTACFLAMVGGEYKLAFMYRE